MNPRTRTPIVSLALVGGTILLFAISLPLEDLAHFADTVLLLALILVNAALIVHRRKYPQMQRPFRVPLVPLLPALGIAANLYLLSQILHHPAPLAMACACLALGMVGFIAWKGFLAEEVTRPGTPSRVALERSAADGEHPFRVLLPLANPDNVPQLVDLAAAIAAERKGEIVAVRVVVVPEQLPPSREDSSVAAEQQVLELAHATAREHDVPMRSLIRIGHDAGRAILETASQRDCNLIIMGWKGYTSTAKKILGEVVDDVVQHARCDIMLVKQVTHEPLRRFLLPTAGGEHARCAESYVASLARARDGTLTVGAVIAPDASAEAVEEANNRLAAVVARLAKNGRPKVNTNTKLIRQRSVSVGIIQAAQDYDAVVIGAAGRSTYPQILFGSIPETIAKRCERPVILVKHHHPIKALLGRVMGEDE